MRGMASVNLRARKRIVAGLPGDWLLGSDSFDLAAEGERALDAALVMRTAPSLR